MKIVEIQKFNSPIINWVLSIILLGLFILFFYTASQKIPYSSIILGSGIFLIVILLIVFNNAKLKIQFGENEIIYQFFPFNLSKKTIYIKEIKSIYVKSIDPLAEFGGYGIRLKSNTTAYIVSSTALYIERKRDRTIVLSISDSTSINKYVEDVKSKLY